LVEIAIRLPTYLPWFRRLCVPPNDMDEGDSQRAGTARSPRSDRNSQANCCPFIFPTAKIGPPNAPLAAAVAKKARLFFIVAPCHLVMDSSRPRSQMTR
jgi:hypothetical protein